MKILALCVDWNQPSSVTCMGIAGLLIKAFEMVLEL